MPAHARPALTLKVAARHALGYHPDLRAAKSDVAAQEARVSTARAPYFPAITAVAQSSRSGSSTVATGGLNVIRSGAVSQYSTGFEIRQRVFDFGQTSQQVKAASEQLQAVRSTENGTAQGLILSVIQAFFDVLKQSQSVRINQENLRNAQAQLNQAQGFLAAGTKAKIDVTNAEAAVANARVALIQATDAESKARVALATAMGETGRFAGSLAQEKLPAPDWSLPAAVKLAMAHRPEVLAADATVRSDRAAVAAAAAAYRPTINANGSYFWQDQVFPPRATSWNLGVELQVPILDEPTLGAAVAQAEATLKGEEARRDSLVLQVQQEVADDLLAKVDAEQRIGASHAATVSAQENYRLAFERYKVGVGNTVELSQAEQTLVQAQGQEIQARFDYQVALAQLYKATGTLKLSVLPGR